MRCVQSHVHAQAHASKFTSAIYCMREIIIFVLLLWSTGFTEREIPMQYYASIKMYASKCMESQVCSDCTYRRNSAFEVLSEDVSLSKDVLLNRIKHKYICHDTGLDINGCF